MAIRIHTLTRQLTAVACSLLLISSSATSAAVEPIGQQNKAPAEDVVKIPNDQLESLVAPVALYPDPLLAQVLAASTYPLEIIQLQQWLAQHKDLKDKALADAVAKQNWDPTVQAMAPLPDVVKRLADDIKWTTDLGNAVLAQQSDVMAAVQSMRSKAKNKGNLKSTQQMKVETQLVESKQVIVIEQADPKVVYVPSYDPVVVYGAPAYPYPPIYYPPAGYYAAGMALSFGVGIAMGAAFGGGWCCNSGWGGGNNNININNNNTFVKGGNRNNGNGNGNWQHNGQHRGGTPYSNRATANKFGGTTRGDSLANRQSGARQNQGGLGASNRTTGGASNLGGGRGNGAGPGGDRVGNRSVSPNAGSGSRGGGLGGGSGGMSGSSARASSSRGGSSMGSSRGGGGGGGRGGGGGGRGGGGRRR